MMAEEVTAAATLFTCRTCGPLPRDAFHLSCLDRFIHRCRQCTQAKNKKYFQSAKDTTLKEWRVRKRASGRFAKMISRTELATIFEVHGRRCFITSLPGPLSLLRADPDREFTAANAVPVLSKISFSLPHLPDDALTRWRNMQTGTTTREAAAAPIIGATAEAGVFGAARRLTDEEKGKEERENQVPSFHVAELAVATVSGVRQQKRAHDDDHFVLHDSVTTKERPRHADAEDPPPPLLPPPPAMCGTDDIRAIAASDGSSDTMGREYPASSFDRAKMMEAGRERVRMLVASRKRKASLVAVVDDEDGTARCT